MHIWRDDGGVLQVEFESALTRAAKLVATASEGCRSNPAVLEAFDKQRALDRGGSSCFVTVPEDPNGVSAEFTDCLTRMVASDLAMKAVEDIKNMRMLAIVGDRARKYTCADPDMKTSNTSLDEQDWLDPVSGTTYHAQV